MKLLALCRPDQWDQIPGKLFFFSTGSACCAFIFSNCLILVKDMVMESIPGRPGVRLECTLDCFGQVSEPTWEWWQPYHCSLQCWGQSLTRFSCCRSHQTLYRSDSSPCPTPAFLLLILWLLAILWLTSCCCGQCQRLTYPHATLMQPSPKNRSHNIL